MRRVLPWLVLAVLVGIVGVELFSLQREEELPDAPAAVDRLTRDFAVAVTSFDHTRLQADLDRVLAMGTEGFERDFRAAMGPNFVEGITANKWVSRGTVVAGPTAQQVTDDRASLLVVVNQEIASQAAEGQPAPEPQLVRVGLLVTVDRTGSEPKVSAVQVL